MIGSHHVGLDERASHELHCRRRREDAVDSPADILGPNPEPLAPPTVMTFALFEVAEGVDPSSFDPAVELRAFLGEKAARLLIGLGARQVDLSVSGVEISHHEHAQTTASEPIQAVEEGGVKVELVGDAAVVPVFSVAIWEINIRQGEAAEARDLYAAFGVEARIQ